MQLLIVDTSGIQPYIFGSNRLRENFGASHLVAQATEEWALEAVRSFISNVRPDFSLDNKRRIEDPAQNLAAEVVYAGGGNIVIIFHNQTDAKAFVGMLSRKIVTDAPNLRLVVAQQPFEWSDSLCLTLNAIFKKVAEKKHTRPLSAPLLGLSVSVMCQSTGLPAVCVTQPIGVDEGYPASAEIHAKLAVATPRNNRPSEAEARLRRMLQPPPAYDYPNKFSHLGGSKGEHSYIAVVHADGNGMGQRIMGIGKEHAAAAQNRDYITALRRLSDAVKEASNQALKATLDKLITQISDGEIRHHSLPKLRISLISENQTGKFLPFRPIVFGGDDVTFVCDGRLGVSLAIEYLKQFEQSTANLPDGKGKATACAGTAIVKSHYPFARAYQLADDLCSSAKKYRRKAGFEGSGFDWHFATSGLFGGIEDIREREYRVDAGSLTLRPVALAANSRHPQRSWHVVSSGVDSFQSEDWADRRNKVKALRDALRDGPAAVKSFLAKFNELKPLPDVCSSMANLKDEGWQGGLCGYFDAVEMIDWFFPL